MATTDDQLVTAEGLASTLASVAGGGASCDCYCVGRLGSSGALTTNTTDYTNSGKSIKLKYNGVYLVTLWTATSSSVRLENDDGWDLAVKVVTTSTPVSFEITYPEVKSISPDDGETNIVIKRIAQ